MAPQANEPDAKAAHAQEIVVFSILKPAVCADCGSEVPKGGLLRIHKEKPLCLGCADLDHLAYLPRGDTALTRRSRKYSGLVAVVVRFSRSRGRYERQGLLVEEAALERAEAECLADEDARRASRERAAVYRERADEEYVAEFARRIGALFPGCPVDEAAAIARHACRKCSGRVGRSAAAKDFDPGAVELAVRAHVRHRHTNYDRLLAHGHERDEARAAVADATADRIDRWSPPR
jgi:hypothetical protein